MTMNIGITLKNAAYTPESYAYKNYLEKFGHKIQLDFEDNLDPDNDVNIYFMGVIPFWKKKQGRAREIHEYQSLSTGKCAKLKNYIKKYINRLPSGRIFLNEFVEEEFNFKDNIPSICRDMGVDDIFYQSPSNNPEFDIVYCGSIQGRYGLVQNLVMLSDKYKVIVIGDIPSDIQSIFKKANIYMTGRLERNYIPEVYRNARFGLNYTPDIYPFNVQTSTKTLEYLASGLDVISNRYYWSEKFFNKIGYKPIWIDNMNNTSIIYPSYQIPNMENYSWDRVLSNSKFESFISKN